MSVMILDAVLSVIHVIAFCIKDRWYIVAGAKRKGKRENEKNNTYDNIVINISFTC